MGIFDKLLGSKKQKTSDSSVKRELRMEYNVMKNISLEESAKYKNSEKYEFVENGIYKDLNDEDDAKYRMTISYELESDESINQYPLEDVLDKYLLHVSDFYESENSAESNKYKLELGGELDYIRKGQEIIGKKVFNRDFIGTDKQIRVNLIIE